MKMNFQTISSIYVGQVTERILSILSLFFLQKFIGLTVVSFVSV